MSYPDIVIDKGIFCAAVILQVIRTFRGHKFFPPSGYRIVDFVGTKEFPWMACIVESDQDVITAFRGSEDIMDFIADIDIVPVQFTYIKHAGLVPKGFLSVYHVLRSQLVKVLTRGTPNKTLYVTGHSLGGSLARLLALDLAVNSGGRNPQVVTLASPKVGDHHFVSLYNSVIRTNVGIFNINDRVPFLPPGYEQVKAEFPIWFQKHNPIKNHLLINYFQALASLRPTFWRDFCILNPFYCEGERLFNFYHV